MQQACYWVRGVELVAAHGNRTERKPADGHNQLQYYYCVVNCSCTVGPHATESIRQEVYLQYYQVREADEPRQCTTFVWYQPHDCICRQRCYNTVDYMAAERVVD